MTEKPPHIKNRQMTKVVTPHFCYYVEEQVLGLGMVKVTKVADIQRIPAAKRASFSPSVRWQ